MATYLDVSEHGVGGERTRSAFGQKPEGGWQVSILPAPSQRPEVRPGHRRPDV